MDWRMDWRRFNVLNYLKRLSRPGGAHIVVHIVRDNDGMNYVVDEYRGPTQLGRSALADAELAAQRVRSILSSPRTRVKFTKSDFMETISRSDRVLSLGSPDRPAVSSKQPVASSA